MSGPAPPRPPADIFLGVRGEGVDRLRSLIGRILDSHRAFRLGAFAGAGEPPPAPGAGGNAGPGSEADPGGRVRDLEAALDDLLERLHSNPPTFHPLYAAQMIKDPAIPAVAGYLAAMLVNPNNHAFEGGPATTEMELEVVDDLLRLVGFESDGKADGWGHLCSGGSLANLEALWAVRDTRPDGPLVFSRAAHYSWRRSAAILRIGRVQEIEVDGQFRLDPDHLEAVLRRERPLMVVANLGSTGTGSIDPLDAILELRERHGFHLHVDAAYGGYARACLIDPAGGLLAPANARASSGLSAHAERQLRLLGRADSITIDPHKHGLLPYGAGSVLYRDRALQRPLLNTAPYTYHLTDRPNLGRLTLEGSRPGATAAAAWLVHRTVPLHAAGLGAVVGGGVRVARRLHDRAVASPLGRPLHEPDLDLLCLARLPDGTGPGAVVSLKRLEEATDRVYRRLSVEAARRPPALVSRFTIPADLACRALPFAVPDGESFSALRLVLMKHWLALPENAGTLRVLEEAVLGS
jgi:glutamate/tyrosine decarboxylase-like PLP-dependent enzyme